MEIKVLSQEDADGVMKALSDRHFRNFYVAFHDERDKPRDQFWALPQEKRLYYQVGSYLFGISCEGSAALLVSSFARIDETSERGSCAKHFKLLIEEKLIPLCRTYGKEKIAARLSPGGVEVFRQLNSIMPRVSLGPLAYYTSGVIEI